MGAILSGVEVIHIKEPKRKTYSLQFDHKGTLIVKTDTTYFSRQLDRILDKHRDWILKQFNKIKAEIVVFNRNFLAEGEIYNILGNQYTLKYIQKDNFDLALQIELTEKQIRIITKTNSRISKKIIKVELIEFFRDFARDYITKRVKYYTKKCDLKFNKIFIKNQKSKWGSCSSAGNLNFNWHLIFAPKDIIDYVIVHEVCHLKHMNHSKKFWDYVSENCKDVERKKEWLEKNGNLIRILG